MRQPLWHPFLSVIKEKLAAGDWVIKES